MINDVNITTGRGGIPSADTSPPPEYKRQESVQTTPTPDYGPSFREYAASQNWMSAIGSQVAATASNALATKIGGEMGKTPHGDLMPSFTNFDKQLAESYSTQAHATLGLQADKLITDSNLELSKVPRLTPEMIAKSQASITKGLQKIYAQAPSNVVPHLQSTYGAAQLNQAEQLNRRMLSEQHEDRRNNTILSNNKNAETAHALAAAGHYDKAMEIAETQAKINSSAVAANIGFSPQQGKVGADTVKQSAINGRLQNEYEAANANKQGEAYLKSLSKRPDWISDAEYPEAQRSLMSYVNNQKAMRSEFEQLTAADFQTRIAVDASSITGTELQSTLDKLSPINAAKVQLAYVTGLKAQMKDQGDQSNLSQNWNDPTAQANSTPKVQNATFNAKVASAIESNPNMSREQAELQVAASAGAAIPVFTSTLKNKLWSGDPAQMVGAAQQMAEARAMGVGHVLQGLNDQDNAIASDIAHSFNPADPAWAARVITENKENQDPAVRKQSETAWSSFIYDNTRKNGTTAQDFVLKSVGLQGGLFHQGFDSPWMKGKYSADIMSVWQTNFINTRGDTDRALAMTKEYVNDNYGQTSVNGKSEYTMHPIEKACGFSNGDGLVSIHKDVVRQISEPMAKLKQAYDEGKTNEYWTVEQNLKSNESRPLASKLALPIPEAILTPYKSPEKSQSSLMMVKHTRNGVATNTESYPLRLVGNNFNWELNVDTDHGPRSIFLDAPQIGVHTYTPDTKWIQANYLAEGDK